LLLKGESRANLENAANGANLAIKTKRANGANPVREASLGNGDSVVIKAN
jgi:hypothetical protein